MRFHRGMGLAVFVLALVIPAAVWADPPSSNPNQIQVKPRRSWFHKSKLCAHCQWEEMRSRGVNVPPPPPSLPGGVATPGNRCDRCGAAVVTTSATGLSVVSIPSPPVLATAPVSVAEAPAMENRCVQCEAAAPVAAAPGYAAVGGNTIGRAVVGGGAPFVEPAPIGMVQGAYAYPAQSMAMAGRAGAAGMGMGAGSGMSPMDPSVRPSSFASEPYMPDEHNRPHIISHLFGLEAIGARSRAERERRARENHAAISYQPLNQQVQELPSSMVYGR